MLDRIRKVRLGFSVLALGALGACSSNSTGPGAGPGAGNVALMFGSSRSAGTASISAGSGVNAAVSSTPETYTLGSTSITFTRVQMVLRDIELKRVEGAPSCPSDDSSTSGDDQCEELELGPVLIDLPLGAADRLFEVVADTGTFREVEFKIHKPEDAVNGDASFLQQHPEFKNVSIRAEGTFNGTAFVYTTDLNSEIERNLVPPLVVAGGANITLSFVVDLSAWFRNEAGTAFVNPNDANKGGSAEGIVKTNITKAFDALKEDN